MIDFLPGLYVCQSVGSLPCSFWSAITLCRYTHCQYDANDVTLNLNHLSSALMIMLFVTRWSCRRSCTGRRRGRATLRWPLCGCGRRWSEGSRRMWGDWGSRWSSTRWLSVRWRSGWTRSWGRTRTHRQRTTTWRRRSKVREGWLLEGDDPRWGRADYLKETIPGEGGMITWRRRSQAREG